MAGRWTQARRALASERMSRTMREKWRDPAFRERQRQRLRARWAQPGYVDHQLSNMVTRWQDDAYRTRQIQAIRSGQRKPPLSGQPDGPPCRDADPATGEHCIRRGPHQFHVATTGTIEDGTYRIHGWQ